MTPKLAAFVTPEALFVQPVFIGPRTPALVAGQSGRRCRETVKRLGIPVRRTAGEATKSRVERQDGVSCPAVERVRAGSAVRPNAAPPAQGAALGYVSRRSVTTIGQDFSSERAAHAAIAARPFQHSTSVRTIPSTYAYGFVNAIGRCVALPRRAALPRCSPAEQDGAHNAHSDQAPAERDALTLQDGVGPEHRGDGQSVDEEAAGHAGTVVGAGLLRPSLRHDDSQDGREYPHRASGGVLPRREGRPEDREQHDHDGNDGDAGRSVAARPAGEAQGRTVALPRRYVSATPRSTLQRLGVMDARLESTPRASFRPSKRVPGASSRNGGAISARRGAAVTPRQLLASQLSNHCPGEQGHQPGNDDGSGDRPSHRQRDGHRGDRQHDNRRESNGGRGRLSGIEGPSKVVTASRLSLRGPGCGDPDRQEERNTCRGRQTELQCDRHGCSSKQGHQVVAPAVHVHAASIARRESRAPRSPHPPSKRSHCEPGGPV